MNLTDETRIKAEEWLSESFDVGTRNEVVRMIAEEPGLAEDSFYKNLEFGTGGLRGIMGVGSNRINTYTIGMATQGLADYLISTGQDELKVAIAFDSRNRSKEFAMRSAEVLSANGIKVYLFDELRPTPLLSYTVRELSCAAGIVITASHNPKEYNGYKVYWNDGGQLVPPHDKGVIEKVRAVTGPDQVKSDYANELIVDVPQHVEESYYTALQGLMRVPADSPAKKEIKIVFTSLHGTGVTMVPHALDVMGFEQVNVLESQATPDGNFPTVQSPNPEESSAMKMAMEEADRVGADIILGTDPDTDRVGMGIRNAAGQMELINGNQAAALLLHFLLENTSPADKASGFVAKTIVTSELLRDICNQHKVTCYDTLTGFKYIAELIGQKEGKEKFIGGGEESYGYLVGDFVRDKDAVISSVMLCEMAAWSQGRSMPVYELLNEVYNTYGLYRESLVSMVKKGKQGSEEIASIMEGYRRDGRKEIAGISIESVADYKSRKTSSLLTGISEDIKLPTSNVLQFFLSDGSKVTARPSGTEPKIKYYISVKESLDPTGSFDTSWKKAGEKIAAIEESLGIRAH